MDRRRGKAQHLAGIKPTASLLRDVCSTAVLQPLLSELETIKNCNFELFYDLRKQKTKNNFCAHLQFMN